MPTKKSLKIRPSIHQQTDWGVPNYQEESEYPKSNDLDDTHWRWEFLRRRQDFRKEWLKHAENSYKWNLNNNKSNSNEAPIPDPMHPKFRAHLFYFHDQIGSLLDKEFDQVEASMEAFRNFGLESSLPNPSIKNPDNLVFSNKCWNRLDISDLRKIERINDDQLIISFNINCPITPQLRLTKQSLVFEHHFRKSQKMREEGKGKNNMRKTPQRRMNKKLWPLYLRVLDARNDGKTFEWIGREILELKKFDYDTQASEAKKAHKIAYDLGVNFPN